MSKQQIWFIAIYFLLLAICAALLIVSDFLSFEARDAVLPIATDGFKLVLGAIVGAVSAMLGTTAHSEKNDTRKDQNDS